METVRNSGDWDNRLPFSRNCITVDCFDISSSLQSIQNRLEILLKARRRSLKIPFTMRTLVFGFVEGISPSETTV